MNPIPELINNKVFAILTEHRLLDDIGVRNYLIRKEFLELRSQKICVGDCLDKLNVKYSYIQAETIRRIAYNVEKRGKQSCQS